MLKFFFKNISRFLLAAILLACLWLVVHRNSNRNAKINSVKNISLSLWLPFQKSITWLITFPENTLNFSVSTFRTRSE